MNSSSNPLLKVHEFGQSIWLDFLRRNLIESGHLQQLVDEDGLRGVTSNPSIFEKAIAGSHDYDEAIKILALEGKSVKNIYETLTVEDVRNATDVFRKVYDDSSGQDGFVSLEVSPHLAHDTQGTISEARRLWKEVDRPNLLIKVPATKEGLPAIRKLISEGINVNVTLLFGLPRYRKVAESYLSGLSDRVESGQPLEGIASVASFFLSRIDVLVDPILEKQMQVSKDGATANRLHGQVAIACAKVAYEIYQEIYKGERFQSLSAKGAMPQRLLWASTSTKNPAYSDVKYVDALIGPETVNTIPLETLNAYRDHGNPQRRLEKDLPEAHFVLDHFPEVKIDIDQVTQQLEDEGVEKFIKPYDRLMNTLQESSSAAMQEPLDRQAAFLGQYEDMVKEQIDRLEEEDFNKRLWRKDASLWKSDPEEQKVISNALGWLHVAEKMTENLDEINRFVEEIKSTGFRHVVHMGMGGSSLAAMVFARLFPYDKSRLPLTVLDTTDPQTIATIEQNIPLTQTLFIVASKSGTTAEPLAFADYFYEKVKEKKGNRAGENFIAITDPGSPLVDVAKQHGFRRTFLNFPDIGGRFSALSYFGMLPAALKGIDIEEILEQALRIENACTSSVPGNENPGINLGAVLGELGKRKLDKVTFIAPSTFGMWLEQLLAESTGKEGRGLLPVAGEPLGGPEAYGTDRLFVQIRLNNKAEDDQDRFVNQLKKAGYPVVTIQLDDLLDIGQEFFRWEIATSTAGEILKINAFNQPNVQESKDNTNRLLEQFEKDGHLPEDKPDLIEGDLKLYMSHPEATISNSLAEFLNQSGFGDYVALLAYLTETPETTEQLQSLRKDIRTDLRLATTLGYGPRYLHSTGQYHKGGPANGLFIMLTMDPPNDLPIPGKPYTFGTLWKAQALGDFQALRKHGQRVLRIHLGSDTNRSLKGLVQIMKSAEKEFHVI